MLAVDEVLRHLFYSGVDRQVVVARRHNQVRPPDRALLIHLVMVIEGAARSLDLACSIETVDAGCGAHVLVEDERIGEDLFDLLDAVEGLDQPRMMIVEGALDGPFG